jgi:hypothetical protein
MLLEAENFAYFLTLCTYFSSSFIHTLEREEYNWFINMKVWKQTFSLPGICRINPRSQKKRRTKYRHMKKHISSKDNVTFEEIFLNINLL